jgi:uncharacterized membrane protein
MAKVLLVLHVVAGIVFIGPVTIAVSLFPRYARLATLAEQRAGALSVLALLRRISVVYAVLGISVPVLGVGVAAELDVVTDTWLLVAMALTLLAAVVLAAVVLPAQRRVLEVLHDPDSPVLHAAATLQRDTPTSRRRSRPRSADVAASSASPPQSAGLDAARDAWLGLTVRLGMASGVFALLWVVVVALMVVRPGSTTSV